MRLTHVYFGLAFAALLAFAMLAGFSHDHAPRAHAATDGAAMSLSITNQTDCPGVPQAGKVCVGRGQQFDVVVNGDAVPLAAGYTQVRAWINYGDDLGDESLFGGLKGARALWPDCNIDGFFFLTSDNGGNANRDAAFASCQSGLSNPFASFYKGPLLLITLTCTPGASSNLITLEAFGGPNAGADGAHFIEHTTGNTIVPGHTNFIVDAVTVSCVTAMSLSVTNQTVCPGGSQAGKVCVRHGQQFDVIVRADAIPVANGYVEAWAWINYGDDLGDQGSSGSVKGAVALWPDCDLDLFNKSSSSNNGGNPNNDAASATCRTSHSNPPPSFFQGALFSFGLTCTQGDSGQLITLEAFGGPNAGADGAQFIGAVIENIIVPGHTNFIVDAVTVNCVGSAVGGISVDTSIAPLPALESRSNDGRRVAWWLAASVALLATIIVAGAVLTAAKGRTR